MTVIQALRRGIRQLARHPGFTAVAVLSLALAIGANTAIFSLLNALLLRDLPVRHPQSLVELSVVRRGDKIPFSFPMFRELERGQKVFSGLIGWSFGEMANVELHGVLSLAELRYVTGNYFSELGATPLLGRLIAPDDVTLDGSAPSPVAVISYQYWQRRFGGAADVVGREIAIEGQPFTVIGVTRKWFTGMTTGEAPDVTVPMKATDVRARLWIFITGRLRDGVSLAQARAQLQSLWPEVRRATTPTEAPGLRRQLFFSMGLDVAPASTGVNRMLRARFTRPLYVLMGIVGLILLIACVNLANLMLARAAARRHETSVRMALGATRWALAREVLTESLTLSAAGAILGLLFAYWASRLLVGLMTRGYRAPLILNLNPDGRVLALAAGSALLTGILFGVAPAWRRSREDPASVLQRGTRSMASGTGKLGKALVVTQIGLSVILVVGAGLLARSFRKLCSLDPGLEENVLEVALYPRPGGYEKLDMNGFRRQLTQEVLGLPGVVSAGISDSSVPALRGWEDTVSTLPAPANPNAGPMAKEAMASPGFFRTLGIGLVSGRDFDWNDDPRHPRVAIVSRGLAERLFPSAQAVGQHIRFGFMPEFQDLEVVGVASDARIFDLHQKAEAVIYLPSLQHQTQFGYLFVRTVETPGALAKAVAHQIELLGHAYALSTNTIAQEVDQALVEERVVALLSGFFAALALLLASVGVYGLMSYTVTRRTREIGIRSALGARQTTVLWLILRDALALGLGGIALGIAGALASNRLIAGLLFGISPRDLPTIVGVSLLLLGVALFSSYLPARRASHIDPTAALRAE